jgi:hypothetical protein
MGDMGFGKCRFSHKECTGDAEVKNEHGIPMCKVCLNKYIEWNSKRNVRQFVINNFSW